MNENFEGQQFDVGKLVVDEQMNLLEYVKEEVHKKYDEMNQSFTYPEFDSEVSNLIFRGKVNSENKKLNFAHIQSIKRQLDKIQEIDSSKKNGVVFEFLNSIGLFDRLTKVFKFQQGVFGDTFIVSNNFYHDAIRGYEDNVSTSYSGSLDFAYIPMKLRLAIECYFKNMIGYISASQTCRGKKTSYRLSIARLLSFFSDERFKKYCDLPVDIEVLKDMNYWSNGFIHTGYISFAWQNLEAIDMIEPLFKIQHEEFDFIHWDGFNYLSPDFDQSDLIKDLNEFLSNGDRKKVYVLCREFSSKPMEGAFYYPRNTKE